jgi:hypothetical protein
MRSTAVPFDRAHVRVLRLFLCMELWLPAVRQRRVVPAGMTPSPHPPAPGPGRQGEPGGVGLAVQLGGPFPCQGATQAIRVHLDLLVVG